MRKTFITATIAIILAFALMSSTFAANFDHLADGLKGLGLLKGNNAAGDVEPDRPPTRAEALAMLIRYLGKGEEAENGEFKNPFTDAAPPWADPYIGYGFENGLTKGSSATLFKPNDPCTAQEFTTFMLRALEYSEEAGDFTYADAVIFGKEVGIIDDILNYGVFLRDDMIAVAYLALGVPPAGGGYDTLLGKLVDDGAVSPEAAAAFFEGITAYSQFMEVIGPQLGGLNAMSLEMAADLDLQLMKLSTEMAIKFIIGGGDIAIAINMATTQEGQEGEEPKERDIYIVEGYIYNSTGEEKIKTEASVGGVDMATLLGMFGGYEINPALFFTGIECEEEEGSIVYSLGIAEALVGSVLNEVMGLLGNLDAELVLNLAGMEIAIGEIAGVEISELKIYTTPEGIIYKIEVDLGIFVEVELDGDPMGAVPVSLKAEISILAINENVEITYPDDLEDYVLAGSGSESE